MAEGAIGQSPLRLVQPFFLSPTMQSCLIMADRGSKRRVVRQGRFLDLARAAVKGITEPGEGLIPVMVVPIETE